MNTLEAVYSRRSIRNFNGESITENELNEILKAAYAAPVGRGKYDSLNLTVITNKEFLDKWQAAMAAAAGNPNMKPLYNAPMVILVSSTVPQGPASNISYSNAAIVVHNMALAATELGAGACHIWGAIMALNCNPELRQALNLPEGMTPCCAIALGHTDESYAVREIPENRIRTEYLK